MSTEKNIDNSLDGVTASLENTRQAFEYMRTDDTEKAKSLLRSSLNFQSSNENSRVSRTMTLNNLATIYKQEGNFEAALDCLTEALSDQMYSQMDLLAVSGTHLNLCAVLSNLEDHHTALQHAQQALAVLLKQNESPTLTSIAYHNLALELEYLCKTEEASTYYLTGWNHAINTIGNKDKITLGLYKGYLRTFQFKTKKCLTVSCKSNEIAPDLVLFNLPNQMLTNKADRHRVHMKTPRIFKNLRNVDRKSKEKYEYDSRIHFLGEKLGTLRKRITGFEGKLKIVKEDPIETSLKNLNETTNRDKIYEKFNNLGKKMAKQMLKDRLFILKSCSLKRELSNAKILGEKLEKEKLIQILVTTFTKDISRFFDIWRKYTQKARLQKDSVSVIQKCFRQMISKLFARQLFIDKYREEEQLNHCVILIQARFRYFMQYQKYKTERYKLEKTATLIQSQLKAYISRRQLAENEEFVHNTENIIRDFIGSFQVNENAQLQSCQMKEIIQTFLKDISLIAYTKSPQIIDQEIYNSQLKIKQCTRNYYLPIKNKQSLRKQVIKDPTVRIQAYMRFLFARSFLAKKRLVGNIKNGIKSFVARKKVNRLSSVVKIKKTFKAFYSNLRFKRFKSVMKIQSAFRRFHHFQLFKFHRSINKN